MRTALMLCGLALATACAGGPGPGDAGYAFNVDGRYAGLLTVAGERFEAEFDLRTAPGGRLYGSFTVRDPVEVVGRMTGRIVDDLLRMSMSYEAGEGGSSRPCASGVEGILTVSGGGEAVDGPVAITDCGQALPGRLSFRRTPVGF